MNVSSEHQVYQFGPYEASCYPAQVQSLDDIHMEGDNRRVVNGGPIGQRLNISTTNGESGSVRISNWRIQQSQDIDAVYLNTPYRIAVAVVLPSGLLSLDVATINKFAWKSAVSFFWRTFLLLPVVKQIKFASIVAEILRIASSRGRVERIELFNCPSQAEYRGKWRRQ